MVEVKNDWDEVIVEDGIWRPEVEDEELVGIYIGKETNVGPYNSTKYNIKNEDGEIGVYGSTALNDRMKEVPIGYDVKIVYKGEKPSKPPKKPFKMFKVFKRKHSAAGSEPEAPEKEAPTLAEGEDVDALRLIDLLTEELIEQHVMIDNEGKALMVLAREWMKDEDRGLTSEMVDRIEKQLQRKG